MSQKYVLVTVTASHFIRQAATSVNLLPTVHKIEDEVGTCECKNPLIATPGAPLAVACSFVPQHLSLPFLYQINYDVTDPVRMQLSSIPFNEKKRG